MSCSEKVPAGHGTQPPSGSRRLPDMQVGEELGCPVGKAVRTTRTEMGLMNGGVSGADTWEKGGPEAFRYLIKEQFWPVEALDNIFTML